jgi:hypothetical protein
VIDAVVKEKLLASPEIKMLKILARKNVERVKTESEQWQELRKESM